MTEARGAQLFSLTVMAALAVAVLGSIAQVWLDFGPWRALLPHATCYRFDPWVIWPTVIADGNIALTFFLTPAGLIWLVARKHAPLPQLWWLIAASYIACGLTHAYDIWTVWYPTYYIATVIRWITVVAGWVIVLALFKVIRAVPTLMELAPDVERALLAVATRMRRLENDKADAMEDFARLVGKLKPREPDGA